jgi:hypothetical protein
MSAFVLEDGVVYHTYSTYARGLDGLWGMYQWLDHDLFSGGTATKIDLSPFSRRLRRPRPPGYEAREKTYVKQGAPAAPSSG